MDAADTLVQHLTDLIRGRLGGAAYLNRMAEGVRKDPQAHIDALVEAGVLRSRSGVGPYYVVQFEPPHEHEWYVIFEGMTDSPEVDNGRPWLLLACRGCHKSGYVPNRLPIEVPE